MRVSQFKVGILFTLAFSILFLTIIFAGSIGDILKPKANIYAVFKDVKGLRQGAPVWFSGIEIGSVREMRFLPENRIKVMMSIDRDALKYLKRDSKASILTLGLLGDKYIEISPGSRGAEQLKETDVIEGTTQSGFQEVVGKSQESLIKITEFIGKLEQIIEKLDTGKGTVPKLINDPALYRNLKKASKDVSLIVRRIKSGKGTAGRLLKEDKLYRDIAASVRDVKEFASTLKSSEGTLKRLMVDRDLYDRFMKATEKLDRFADRLNNSEGTLNRMIKDPELYNNLNELSKRLNLLAEQLEKSEGLWKAMTSDKEMVTELKKTLKELNLLIKDIKEHPKRYFKFSIF